MSDVSGLNHLAADLIEAGLLVGAKAFGIAHDYAETTERDARAFAPKGPHLPHYAASITSDVTATPTGIVAEVGPDKDLPQGPLGNLLEYGKPGQPPEPHLGP